MKLKSNSTIKQTEQKQAKPVDPNTKQGSWEMSAEAALKVDYVTRTGAGALR